VTKQVGVNDDSHLTNCLDFFDDGADDIGVDDRIDNTIINRILIK